MKTDTNPNTMTPETIAQWVIENRYPKSENEKVSDSEMYHTIVDMLRLLTETKK